jgi:hypothetical protein
MQFTGYVLMGVLGLFSGLLIGEVSLPGVGTLKKVGSVVTAEIGDTSYKSQGGEVMIMTPGLGFMSENSEGVRVGCIEGAMLASKGPDVMSFVAITKARKPRLVNGKPSSIPDLVSPKKGSLVIVGKTQVGEEGEFTSLDIARVVDEKGTQKTAINLLLNDRTGEMIMINIIENGTVLISSPSELSPRAKKGEFHFYGFAR